MQILTNGRLFDGERLRDDVDVVVADGRIAAIVDAGAGAHDGDVVDLAGHLLAPGLVDLQINGGGGVLFNDSPDVETLRRIGEAHRAHGTTAFLPTLISDDNAHMRAAAAAVDAAIAERVPGVLGVHFEGPYLNVARRGAHPAKNIRPLPRDIERAFPRPANGVTLVTVAPECVGLDVIRQLSRQGVIVFGGHSEATYDEARDALDAGMRGFTHLYNAMSPLTAREPGMVGAALEDRQSIVAVIADGIHVHPAAFAIAVKMKQRGKVLLVTDAMPTVGATTTTFKLGDEYVAVRNGACRTDDGTLAGAHLGLNDAVRNAIRFAGIDRFEALRMASTFPAIAVRLDRELGYVRPGYRASLVELDKRLNVIRTWVDGDMLTHPLPESAR